MSLIRISIKFNKVEYTRVMSAFKRVEIRGGNEIKSIMQKRSAIEFRGGLIKNLIHGKFSAFYSAYKGTRYPNWKQEYAARKGFWRLADDLLKSISTFKFEDGYMSGVPKGATDTGGKSWLGKGDFGESKSIVKYGGWMEWGRTGQPERPLFGPTTDEYSKGPWQKQGRQSLTKIRGMWR